MINIEVIGLDPPCKKCNQLLENANKAVQQTGIEAKIEKKWTLSDEKRFSGEILNSTNLM